MMGYPIMGNCGAFESKRLRTTDQDYIACYIKYQTTANDA